jgi:glutamyl endopeptidase
LVSGRSRPLRPIAIETVIGIDERVRIYDTDLQPWRMVCVLKIRGPAGAAIGTGWLVGPKTVLTAGHCVNHPMLGGWATQIE